MGDSYPYRDYPIHFPWISPYRYQWPKTMKIERLVGRGEQLLPGVNHAPAWEISKWNGMITILFGTFMLFHDCIWYSY
jgi:hypothetical protein